jgi:hypothetical protein
MEVAKSPGGEMEKPRISITVEPLFKQREFMPAKPVTLTFKITDSTTGLGVAGLKDVQVLAFELPGIWQQRQWARDLGGGLYEATQVFPRVGLYNVLLRVESRGARFADLPYTRISIVE